MRPFVFALCVASLAVMPGSLRAQTAKVSQEQRDANYHAHRGDFDYLLGDWEFTVVSNEYGPSHGRWSAVRLAQGQLLDEFRIVDDKGGTLYVTTTLRAYNAILDRWELVGMDQGNGLRDVGTGRRVGAEITLEQTFGAMSEQPRMMRIRYYNITEDHFSWVGDVSIDGGKTWISEAQRIEARRIGPSRSLGALTPSQAK